MRGQNRRELLKGGFGLIAGAIGIGAVAGPADAGARTGATTLTLDGIDVVLRVEGVAPGRRPQAGEQVTIHGHLARGGRLHGTFAARGTAIRVPSTGEIATLEQHLFDLPEGTISGAGRRTGPSGELAITGGTGRFAGARGTYTAHLDPEGLGGDGTARFTFTFTNEER
jgi:hypothetical protein